MLAALENDLARVCREHDAAMRAGDLWEAARLRKELWDLDEAIRELKRRDAGLDLYAVFDGWVVTFKGEEVACFPNYAAASKGLRDARMALVMLDSAISARSAA